MKVAFESRAITRGATVGVCPCLKGYDQSYNQGYVGPYMDDEQAAVGADVVTSASNTTMDVIKVLGIGFLGYLALKHVVPSFVGAASETKKKRHEYDMIDRRERERREEREEARRADREQQKKATRGSYYNDGEIIDAEFEPNSVRGNTRRLYF